MGSRSNAEFTNGLIVCIARSKYLTYLHLLTNICLALICFILSLLPGQVSVIDDENVSDWEDICTSETLLVSFLSPFRFYTSSNNDNEMACPWPVTNIAMRLTGVSLMMICNGYIFGLICKYAEHECTWKILRYFMWILSAFLFSTFVLDCNQLRIGSTFCENGGEIDDTSVLPGGANNVDECNMVDYYITVFSLLACVISNSGMTMVMNLFLRVKKSKKQKGGGGGKPKSPKGGGGPQGQGGSMQASPIPPQQGQTQTINVNQNQNQMPGGPAYYGPGPHVQQQQVQYGGPEGGGGGGFGGPPPVVHQPVYPS